MVTGAVVTGAVVGGMRPAIHDAPELAFSLDARELQVAIEIEDGRLVLHLYDANQHIAVVAGGGLWSAQAETNAERLADLALQFAGLVKVRAGSWTPLTIKRYAAGGSNPEPTD